MNLDLHGVKHIDVENLVINHISTVSPPYQIITGNSDKMKEIVLNILKENDFKYVIWSYNLGSINVLE